MPNRNDPENPRPPGIDNGGNAMPEASSHKQGFNRATPSELDEGKKPGPRLTDTGSDRL